MRECMCVNVCLPKLPEPIAGWEFSASLPPALVGRYRLEIRKKCSLTLGWLHLHGVFVCVRVCVSGCKPQQQYFLNPQLSLPLVHTSRTRDMEIWNKILISNVYWYLQVLHYCQFDVFVGRTTHSDFIWQHIVILKYSQMWLFSANESHISQIKIIPQHKRVADLIQNGGKLRHVCRFHLCWFTPDYFHTQKIHTVDWLAHRNWPYMKIWILMAGLSTVWLHLYLKVTLPLNLEGWHCSFSTQVNPLSIDI